MTIHLQSTSISPTKNAHIETPAAYALPAPTRVDILGVHVSAINMDQAVAMIADWINRRAQNYVCVTPLHGIIECQQEPELKPIFNGSGLTTPDGMGIVLLLKLYGMKHVGRVYGPDLMLAVCEKSLETGWRHYFYGGQPGVADQLAANLSRRFPGLQVLGCESPPFRPMTPAEDQAAIARINQLNPDIVWLGISTPRQDRWMAEHMGKINAPVMVGVGAAFDFHSGAKKQAPLFFQRFGMEWLFRLATEPRRLWPRYAPYPYYMALALLQWIKNRR